MQEQYRKDNLATKETILITQELLVLYKQEFIQILEQKKDPALLAFQQVKIGYKEPSQIELRTDTTFNKHFLDGVKDQFHTLLENYFKQSIILTIQIDESLRSVVSYQESKSQAKIFEELAQKYPLLNTLKDKLGFSIN